MGFINLTSRFNFVKKSVVYNLVASARDVRDGGSRRTYSCPPRRRHRVILDGCVLTRRIVVVDGVVTEYRILQPVPDAMGSNGRPSVRRVVRGNVRSVLAATDTYVGERVGGLIRRALGWKCVDAFIHYDSVGNDHVLGVQNASGHKS